MDLDLKKIVALTVSNLLKIRIGYRLKDLLKIAWITNESEGSLNKKDLLKIVWISNESEGFLNKEEPLKTESA